MYRVRFVMNVQCLCRSSSPFTTVYGPRRLCDLHHHASLIATLCNLLTSFQPPLMYVMGITHPLYLYITIVIRCIPTKGGGYHK